MKWNNHGWGLREMLFLSAILLFFVFLVAILVNQLYKNFEPLQSTTKNSYEAIEINLRVAAKKYVTQTKDTNTLITSDTLLLENFLDEEDLSLENDTCEGYVLKENNQYTSYIHCSYYETKGY